MKIDNEKFIDVGKIVQYYGKDVIIKVAHIRAVTGCDTTSHLLGVRKVKVFKSFKSCVNSKEKMNLLQHIGVPLTINKETVGKVPKLIKTTTPE